jgi:CBS domain-containing protein
MKVADIMTHHVVSVAPDATILDAIALMHKHRFSGLPVIDHDGKLVGIVTEADFLRRPETGTTRRRSRWLDAWFGATEGAKAYVQSHGMRIADVMTRNVVTVTPDAPLDHVVHLMEVHEIKRLPVLHAGTVVGIVSRANLMHALASVHRAAPPDATDDAATRERILAEIDRQTWSVGADVDVVVRAGIADVWGTLAEPAQRDALKVLIERTPGIKQVVDHLHWDGGVTPT